MKLRNKKTGEIIDSKDLLTDEYIIDLFTKNFGYFEKKMNQIQNDWEVYIEPKRKYWFVTWSGDVDDETDDGFEVDKCCKEIGNYFETREEAEKVVEKLKAWKRLKDKGVKFKKESFYGGCTYKISAKYDDDYAKDLLLLFGGEE